MRNEMFGNRKRQKSVHAWFTGLFLLLWNVNNSVSLTNCMDSKMRMILKGIIPIIIIPSYKCAGSASADWHWPSHSHLYYLSALLQIYSGVLENNCKVNKKKRPIRRNFKSTRPNEVVLCSREKGAERACREQFPFLHGSLCIECFFVHSSVSWLVISNTRD